MPCQGQPKRDHLVACLWIAQGSEAHVRDVGSRDALLDAVPLVEHEGLVPTRLLCQAARPAQQKGPETSGLGANALLQWSVGARTPSVPSRCCADSAPLTRSACRPLHLMRNLSAARSRAHSAPPPPHLTIVYPTPATRSLFSPSCLMRFSRARSSGVCPSCT